MSRSAQRIALVVVVIAIVLSACSADKPPRPAYRKVTIAIAGDVQFVEKTATLLNDPDSAFGPVSDVFRRADLAMVNLESAVTTRGTPEPKYHHFRAPSTAYVALRAAGIDAVTIANNHSLDFGRVGLGDTLDFAEKSGVQTFGAGRTATEAYAPWISRVKGTTVAVLGISQVDQLASSWSAGDHRSGIAHASDVSRSLGAVRAASARADLVIVFMHWGQEGNACPTTEMTSFARRLADAGADAIVGTHAHLLQGDGWLGSTYVAYGLGNFVWRRNDAFSNDTGVLRLGVGADGTVEPDFVPAVIDRNTGQPIPVTGSEADRVMRKFHSLRACTGLAGRPTS